SWFVPPIHCARQCKRVAWQAIWQCNDIRRVRPRRNHLGRRALHHRQGPVVLQWTALPASAASRILMRSRKGDRQNRRLKCSSVCYLLPPCSPRSPHKRPQSRSLLRTATVVVFWRIRKSSDTALFSPLALTAFLYLAVW